MEDASNEQLVNQCSTAQTVALQVLGQPRRQEKGSSVKLDRGTHSSLE